jgi:hypothetical protein
MVPEEKRGRGRPLGSRNPKPNFPGLMTLADYVGERTGRGERTAFRLVRRGLPVVKIGAATMVNPEVADAWFLGGMPEPPKRRRRVA